MPGPVTTVVRADVMSVAADILSIAAAALPPEVAAAMQVYRSLCAPPLDCCDLLAVHVPSVATLTPVSPTSVSQLGFAQCFYATNATYVLTLSECVATPDAQGVFPSAVRLDEDFVRITSHAWTIYCALLTAMSQGWLTTEVSGCQALDPPDMECMNPGGGCAGYTFTLRVAL